jgi:tetratricopeptide (TPR) repeat protein
LALDTAGYPNLATALAATFERAAWWAWELKTRAELDGEKREAIYRQGIQHFPNCWELHGNFALFMADVRGDADEAERLYRKALELDRHHANNTGNCGAFLVAHGRTHEALPLLHRACILNKANPNQLSGEVGLYIGIIERCAGPGDTQALGRLKKLLRDSFPRARWSFDGVLEFAHAKISGEDHAFYSTAPWDYG